jgi:hypothetical protein
MSTKGAGNAAHIRGVPHPLPAGEHVLWEGAPAGGAMATHVFHRRLFALYFVAVTGWWAATTTMVVGSSEFLAGLGVRLGLAVAVMAVVEVLARVSARTTWYAITNRRVVLKIGMVIEMSINIPFSAIESAGAGTFRDGTGQVMLSLVKSNRLAYIALWPHCSVFSINHPQPILRGLADAQHVGTLLANAVAEAAADDTNSRVERTSVRDTRQDAHARPFPVGA